MERSRAPRNSRDAEWRALAEQVAGEVTRFQEASDAVDSTAAAILAIDRRDLPCLSLLLFGGAATIAELAGTLKLPLAAVRDIVARFELAVRAASAGTDAADRAYRARAHVDWAVVGAAARAGDELLTRSSVVELKVMLRFLRMACALQESHMAALRPLLEEPGATRRGHRRGGLSPAALRNVQLLIEAHLDRPLRAADLAARAGLSVYHFTRAFRVSTGVTPRACIDQRRIARARTLVERTDRPLATSPRQGVHHPEPLHDRIPSRGGIHAGRVSSIAAACASACGHSVIPPAARAARA
jgi:AraC family transcriptional regulator